MYYDETIGIYKQPLNDSNVIPPARPLPSALIRKRQREPERSTAALFSAFSVTSHPSTSSTGQHSSLIVTPLLWIPRANLPFAFLDLAAPTKRSISTGQFFRAHLPDFEEKSPSDDSICLVVKVNDDARLHVVERCGEKTYVLCRLASRIALRDLKDASQPCSRPWKSARTYGKASPGAGHWWEAAAVVPDRPVCSNSAVRDISEAAESSNDVSTSAPDMSESSHLRGPISDDASPGTTSPPLVTTSAEEAIETSIDHTVCFNTLLDAYLDALYISKASLAYFVKGPLTRLRSAFESKMISSDDAAKHEDFLRGMMLSATSFENKYKEALPALTRKVNIKEIDQNGTIAANDAPCPERRRKPTRLKPSKTGIFVDEDAFVARWWASASHSSLHPDGADLLQSCLVKLRFRESLLQLILILEVLALEHQRGQQDRSGLAKNDASKASVKKPKKRQDLKLSLEMLVDRLSIWQSVSVASPSKSEIDATKAQTSSSDDQGPTDALKEFVTELVIPFFASRCESAVRSLCKKLGISQKTGSPSSMRRHAKISSIPGQAVKRRGPQQDKSVRRKEVKSVKSVPSLQRAATDTFADQIKRERSSTPALSISSTSAFRPPSRANSMHVQNRASVGREVDISAIAKYNKARSRAKPNVEEELKDAIATLKKPNRSLAVKDFVDASDERRPAILGRPVAKRPASNVFIDATPKRQIKHRHLMAQVAPAPPEICETSPLRPEEMIPSTMQAVPQSVQKEPSLSLPQMRLDSDANFSSRFPETPSKTANKIGAQIEQTPLKNLPSNIPRLSFVTPVKTETSRLMLDNARDRGTVYEMEGTSSSRIGEQRSGVIDAQLQGNQEDSSIYDSLGWDD